MAGTFLCPRTCGFVKVATIEIARKARSEARKRGDETASQFRARIHEEQFRLFEEIFKDLGEQTLNYKGFVKKLPALLEKFNKWSSKKLDQKAKYMNVFSLLHWKQLPTAQKREHTMSNCKSCNVRHSETLALFPVNSNNIRGKALKNPVFAASQVNDSLRGAAGKVSPTQRDQISSKIHLQHHRPILSPNLQCDIGRGPISSIGAEFAKQDQKRPSRGKKTALPRNQRKRGEPDGGDCVRKVTGFFRFIQCSFC